MTIEHLEGIALDAQVLRSLGLEVEVWGDLAFGTLDGVPIAVVGDPTWSPFVRSPSRNCAVASVLIERHGIGLTPLDGGGWQASCRGAIAIGPTLPVAAMRALCLRMYDVPPVDMNQIRKYSSREILARLGEAFMHDRQAE